MLLISKALRGLASSNPSCVVGPSGRGQRHSVTLMTQLSLELLRARAESFRMGRGACNEDLL